MATSEVSFTIKEITASATLDLRQRILWPNKPLQYVRLPQDNKGIHFGLYREKQLIAVGSLFIEGAEAQFRKLATTTNEQGKGYGSLLLSHIMDYCKAKAVERIWCNARVDKQDFYLKRGLKPTKEKFSKYGIAYLVMEKRTTRTT